MYLNVDITTHRKCISGLYAKCVKGHTDRQTDMLIPVHPITSFAWV